MPTVERVTSQHVPTVPQIQKAFQNAVKTALEQDLDLIALGAHEQAIAHRIAVYLESYFPGFHTDCEYNRREHRTKRRSPNSNADRRNMRPDILVHRRNDDMFNILAVEIKANANADSPDDQEKLRCLMCNLKYKYKTAAFVRMLNATNDIREGVLRAVLQWFKISDGQFIGGISKTLKCSTRVKDVLALHAQRQQR